MLKQLREAWCATRFSSEEVALFAHGITLLEARRGVTLMSMVLMWIFGASALLFHFLHYGNHTIYTCTLLSVLSGHIMLSARVTREPATLYMLGTTLLMISGTAFVLLANRSGEFNQVLFSSTALLFMVAPLVPWGLREALLVTSLIYLTFTVSTLASYQRFDVETLWSLQFIMLSAGLISLLLVTRNTCVRKADLQTRFDLVKTNRRMSHLSNKDPLTGAWNRRFLKNVFDRRAKEWHAAGKTFHFAYFDLDNFKPINDTCGHEYGDEVLRSISLHFTTALGEDGYLIRMGGDEFALLFTTEAPEQLIDECLRGIRANLRPAGQCDRLPLGLSVGLVSVPVGVHLPQESIYREADEALYQAKAHKHLLRETANIVNRVLAADSHQQAAG